MKKLLILFASVSFLAVNLHAQLTSPAPSPGVGLVTPTPSTTPTQTTIPQGAKWHHYSINLAQVQALGTGASASLTLDTLPANSVVEEILIKPSAALAGPSATTGTITIRTVTGTLMSAYTVIGITPGATIFNLTTAPTSANSVVWASGALSATIASDATGGLAALTAFAADVYVKYATLP